MLLTLGMLEHNSQIQCGTQWSYFRVHAERQTREVGNTTLEEPLLYHKYASGHGYTIV